MEMSTSLLNLMRINEEDASKMLCIAAEFGYVNIVQGIMKNGKCDPAAGDNYAIRVAASFGHLEVMRYLMNLDSKYGIGPGAGDNTAIRKAAEGGHGRSGFKIWN